MKDFKYGNESLVRVEFLSGFLLGAESRVKVLTSSPSFLRCAFRTTITLQ